MGILVGILDHQKPDSKRRRLERDYPELSTSHVLLAWLAVACLFFTASAIGVLLQIGGW